MKLLNKIQRELKAPKGQFNSFGKYYYRNCEDILEAVKPLLGQTGTLILEDEVVQLGDRYYVKATATLREDEKWIASTAYAREALDKKGMDDAQITGAASSYARKYALNGLFCIDDTKDADSKEPEVKTVAKAPKVVEVGRDAQKQRIKELVDQLSYTELTKGDEYKEFVFVETGLELVPENYGKIVETLELTLVFEDDQHHG